MIKMMVWETDMIQLNVKDFLFASFVLPGF